VTAVDVSRHRIQDLAPVVLRQLEADESKIVCRCGPMDSLPYPDGSLNFVVFCQALYLSGDPVRQLSEVWRVLAPGGLVIVACERIDPDQPAWRRLLQGMKQLAAVPSGIRDFVRTGCAPDVSGRHRYRHQHYVRFLSQAGFEITWQDLEYPVMLEGALPSTNYFGHKPAMNKTR
jgi:ubiquinone/menaquinone biosynthesis C-methylase UbiE